MGVLNDVSSAFARDRNLRRAVALLLLSGGSVAFAVQYFNRRLGAKMRREEAGLVLVESRNDMAKKEQRFAVDRTFLRRLRKILHIIVPGATSPEAGMVVLLGALLVARTVASLYIVEIIGRNAQFVVAKQWDQLSMGIVNFALVTLPAAVINSGLKYSSSLLSLMWRVRLSDHVHNVYLHGSNFYNAVHLGGADRIDNADQRVTSDIKQFSDELAELYTTVFKPVLDVVLFTAKLTTDIGWQAPALMYGYFFVSGWLKRVVMPRFGAFIARESSLEGTYRTCHNRLIVNAEEIAFYNGADKERAIIGTALQTLIRHVRRFRFLKFLVGIVDQLLVKYWSSMVGYLALIWPIAYPNNAAFAARTTADLTRDYIRTSQYLTALSTAVGDILLSANKLTNISGYTARVSQLLEMIAKLETKGVAPFQVREDGSSERVGGSGDDDAAKRADAAAIDAGRRERVAAIVSEWRERCDKRTPPPEQPRRVAAFGGGTYERGAQIEFQNVDIVSPDGKLLVRGLNLKVERGTPVMVTGPNGSGKSSIFRVIGELWPLQKGKVIKPPQHEILFVPQKPYLVIGTLRDQLIYPHSVEQMRARGVSDEDLGKLLSIVDPAGLILKEWRYDDVRDWTMAFSGGQKQRVGMARLFYHRPSYAILDECTSAVSDEVEDQLYSTCAKLDITLFTVSHRKSLRRHHEYELALEGGMAGKWTFSKIDREDMTTPMTRL